MKKVIAFGTFDHFHAGHESYLRQARELGEHLTVIIARDETVERLKGRRPDYSERERRKAVMRSGIAERVVLGQHGDKYAVLLKYKPDVIALGYDQFAFTIRLKKFLIDNGMDAKIVRLEPYKPEVHKTSIIRTQKLAGLEQAV
ncbi:FAD synthase [Candidatus Peregrinibacteria bacterium CG11_big_fil_rev_8_21_14_0_20_46_8]|nr:MAG: FAD synthase [Candidatus Peregrinibacteria bacterium CG11_big_fil_rev_8_21_14_0_20_46_8]